MAERYRSLEGSDDFQICAFVEVLFAMTAACEGRHDEALRRSMSVVEAHEILGIRAWIFKEAMEEVFEAALALGDMEASRSIVTAVEAIPIGERSPVIDAAVAGYGGASRGGPWRGTRGHR